MSEKMIPQDRPKVNPGAAHRAWVQASRRLYPKYPTLTRHDFGSRLALAADYMAWWRRRANREAGAAL